MQYTLCSNCNYPIKVDYAGQHIACPYCGTKGVAEEVKVLNRNNGIAQTYVVLPTWLVASTVGLIIGIIFGPTLLASSKEGALKLAKIAEEKLKGR